jgi:hypothetical protein
VLAYNRGDCRESVGYNGTIARIVLSNQMWRLLDKKKGDREDSIGL